MFAPVKLECKQYKHVSVLIPAAVAPWQMEAGDSLSCGMLLLQIKAGSATMQK